MNYFLKLNELIQKIPNKAAVLAAVVLIIIVWFLLPYIEIANIFPFSSSSARVLILLLTGIGWFVKILIAALIKHKKNFFTVSVCYCKKTLIFFKTTVHNFLKSSYSFIRKNYSKIYADKNKKRINKLPWYVVLGSVQSGKKSLITNFGLYFTQAKHFGIEAESYIQQFPDYDWLFSEQAVIIDAMSQSKEDDSQSWKKFIKLLHKERKNKPINGIILTFSLVDVLLYSNQKRQEFIQDICMHIREIYTAFKSQVPVYIVFTKADLVEGFMEFFNELSKEELRQIWGMTLPLSIGEDVHKALQFYQEEYSAIIDKLRSHVLWSLDAERNGRGRELIHSFPQQMQLLRRPIETLLMELFSGVRYQKALLLRGIYFGSNKQEGEPHDFLLQAMSKKFQLIPPVVQRPQRMGECYFLRNLFQQVIYPEAQLLGDSERSRKVRKIMYHTVQVAAPVLIILTTISLHTAYQANKTRMFAVKNNIIEFQQLQLALNSKNDSLNNLLPLLQQLHDAQDSYSKNLPLSMHFLFATSVIRRHINQALERVLSNLFLPRAAAQIENWLNQNIVDQNLLYATLKAYLVFNPNSNTSNNALQAPLQYFWKMHYKDQPADIKTLDYYLDLALRLPVTKLPLDEQLIRRIRDELEAIIPSQRAYGLLQLKASISALPKLLINIADGEHFTTVFQTSNNSNLAIPTLYTKIGYEKIFLPQYRLIATEVSQDNTEIGLSHQTYETQNKAEIIAAMQEAYQQDYLNTWNSALASLNIRPFTDLASAISSIQLLNGSESPLQKLLILIYNNTSSVPLISANFSTVNHYQWHTAQKGLLNLQNYLMAIEQSVDVDKAEYQAVLQTIKSGTSPIIDLTMAANKAPEPIKHWLNDIANNSWKVLITGAHRYVNTVWQEKVMQEYNANISSRFPIAITASSNVSIVDFNHFFAPQGILINYFKQYIKPFVATDKPIWSLYQIQGHNFQLNTVTLAIFQRAKLISTEYFSQDGKSAHLSFSIKPLLLDANASSVNFVIGQQEINYSHGPQNTTNITWPLSETNQRTQLILSTFNGKQFTRSATGPWSIFKLLEEGNVSEEQLGNYLFTMKMDGYAVSYQFFGSNDKGIYQLSSLKNFNLPNNITG